MEAKLRQDRNGVRTPVDVDRRYNRVPSEVEDVKKKVDKYEVDDVLSTSSTNPVQNKVVTHTLDNKVTKEAGKGLSTNDFTTAEKNKLSGVEQSAEVNVLESISINGTAQQITNKNVDLIIQEPLTVLDCYPIGSYYETSDTSFDPNTTWGGTWLLDNGRWHRTA